ncbi:S25-RNase [Pyrus ussuriensis x Pyrus communis]|uniref:S25-RNase n=1 Tax=Pyrus ussuriensis x Pyrus communis TaxID=2448454 RepID=A0A5N5FE62_9ROSA|nr:S25-RNase [Pyrus ussuriensis x Pyrus communis]
MGFFNFNPSRRLKFKINLVMMKSSQSTASARHGLTQNEPHNATEQAPQFENHIEPLELEDSEEEVETTSCAIYQPNQPIILAKPIFGNRKKAVD